MSNNKWFVPYVIEPSAGVERGVLALLNEAFKIDEKNSRTLLALKPHLSPIKAAVIPLKRNNEELEYVLTLIKKNNIINECYKKAEHFINLSYNSLSVFEDSEEKNILKNLTSFSIERNF